MKKKTVEILLSSFIPSGFPQERGLRKYQFYYDLFSDLTEGGIRSSIYQLVEKRYLSRLSVNGQSFFHITEAGIGKLTLLYPSLRIKERKKGDIRGHLLILLKPISDDPHFLKLRKIISAESFSQVIRGVYFYPFAQFPGHVFTLLLNKYSSAVSIVEVKEFSLAFPEKVELSFSKKKELEDSLSRISRTIEDLIEGKVSDNRKTYQSKIAVEVFFKFLVGVFDPQKSFFFDQKNVRESVFQAIGRWNDLIQIHYFSHKK